MNSLSPFDAFIPAPDREPVRPCPTLDRTVSEHDANPSADNIVVLPVYDDCWNRIGVKGDRSCPELSTHVHCRNCPVFADAGLRLFDREAPEGHLREWTERLAERETVTERGSVSVLIFRVAEEWLALNTCLLAEIAIPRPVHIIPSRSNQVLSGLVNIRGELELCVSLAGLLGLEGVASPAAPHMPGKGWTALAVESHDLAQATVKSARPTGPTTLNPASTTNTHHSSRRHEAISTQGAGRQADDRARRESARLMVVMRNSHRWVFQVDEVEGVAQLSPSDITNVPSTVAGSVASYSRGLLWLGERRIGYLDDTRLFDSLERSLV